MNKNSRVGQWDDVMAFLEGDVVATTATDLLAEEGAAGDATALRAHVREILRGRGALLPRETAEKRDLLKRLIERRRATGNPPAVAFSAPDELSEPELDALLRTLLGDLEDDGPA